MSIAEAFLHPIERIEVQPGYRILVFWKDGGQSMVDFSDDVAHGPAFAPLKDERLFAQVRLVREGTVIAWPEPIGLFGDPDVDVDADGLWHMAQAQNIAVAAE
jgi:Protein of unknown function (DUF2442)